MQVNLRHGKVNKNIKRPRQKKFDPEEKVAKTGYSGLEFRMVRFSQNR
jgi:hypothetical protein